MPTRKLPSPTLPVAKRREIFRALVEAQDRRMSVALSREKVAKKFRLSPDALRRIEEEGLALKWPPLDEGD
jgi:hypothetical protein